MVSFSFNFSKFLNKKLTMAMEKLTFSSNSEMEMLRKFHQKSQKLSMFATIRWYFILFGIIPIPESSLPISSRKYQSTINLLHIGFIIVSLLLYAASLVYFVLFEAKSFAEYSEVALFLAAMLLQWVFYYTAVSRRCHFVGLMNDLLEIFEKS